MLEYLKKHRVERITGRTLLDFLPDQTSQDNLWQANLRRLIFDWIEETRDTELPVSVVEDYFCEALADQDRLRNLGDGVFLSTVHSVKNLEFDHVFMLGNNWKENQGDEIEEERRLYYVGMSRARETLTLFSIQDIHNPHVSILSGDCYFTRALIPSCDSVLPGKH